jgi:hypothetical protein
MMYEERQSKLILWCSMQQQSAPTAINTETKTTFKFNSILEGTSHIASIQKLQVAIVGLSD